MVSIINFLSLLCVFFMLVLFGCCLIVAMITKSALIHIRQIKKREMLYIIQFSNSCQTNFLENLQKIGSGLFLLTFEFVFSLYGLLHQWKYFKLLFYLYLCMLDTATFIYYRTTYIFFFFIFSNISFFFNFFN